MLSGCVTTSGSRVPRRFALFSVLVVVCGKPHSYDNSYLVLFCCILRSLFIFAYMLEYHKLRLLERDLAGFVN